MKLRLSPDAEFAFWMLVVIPLSFVVLFAIVR